MSANAKRAWLEGHLTWVASEFGVELVGDIVHGPRIRSVGAKVRAGAEDAWLRVVFEDPEWGVGDYLASNLAANEIRDVPKPEVIRWREWDDEGRRLRGELMTYIPDRPLSETMILTTVPDLSDDWFRSLRGSLLLGRIPPTSP